jgi:signal transduction histidine kinase
VRHRSAKSYLVLIPYFLIIISISICIIYSRYYLNRSSIQFENEFRLQNYSELSRQDTYALAQRLNALSSSLNFECIVGTRDGFDFFSFSRDNCGSGLFSKQFEITNSGSTKIAFTIVLPLEAKLVLIAMILAQIILLISVASVTSIANKLQRATELKLVEVATQASHDIRSPVSALNVIITTALLSDPQKELISAASRRINDIANSLLQIAKPNSYTTDDRKVAEVSILKITNSIIDETRAQYKNLPKITFHTNFDVNESLKILCNQSDLARIISNLLNNAVESIENAGTILISLSQTANIVHLKIQDNGCGIEPTELSKVGEKGYSLKRYNAGSGTGLGLSNAKALLTEWGASLEIESTPRAGTTVTVLLKALS